MIYLEFIIRIAGVTVLLVMAASILRDAWRLPVARYGFALAITLSAVLATSVSAQSIAAPQWMRAILLPLSSTSAIFIWWYSLALFDDDFRLGPVEWSVAAVWTVLGMFNIPSHIAMSEPAMDGPALARSIIAIGIAFHIVYVAIGGRKADLVEERRRVRMFYALAILALFMIDLMSERFFGFYFTPLTFNVIQLSAFLAVIIWSYFWLMRLDSAVLEFKKTPLAETPSPDTLNGRERDLHGKLIRVMEQEKAYLEPELSIVTLAERVGAPEHQLRALINRAMGHRNFRSFLNGYRMTTAKEALSSPDQSAVPILTIAMESGFASLASFNRAFKLSTGMTPSDFRKNALSDANPGSQN